MLLDRLSFLGALLGRQETLLDGCPGAGRYEDLFEASVERLATHDWVVGRPLEAEEWRRRVNAAARLRGWKLVTGAGSTGYPSAARTDLEGRARHTVATAGLRPRRAFEM